ncbi:hypothetical protein [Paludisphaera mucosa]|uniref:Uncharacterized protein n=1 Tax=Paludisphaera mucosa TaxID=3030827 RepID=A0ABT6FF10_9BACT|nr:hypothetical protein [Paludisphaera mucosa]MDG3006170.1 hypothetical protein [Paludisphaera mucosa]
MNQVTDGDQYKARSTVGPDGVTTIVWEDRRHAGDGFGVYARRIDASGKPLGDQFRVDTATAGQQEFPLIGSDALGNVLIAWKEGQFSTKGLVQYYQR